MGCLGLKPGAAGWKLSMNPLSYGGTPTVMFLSPEYNASENSPFFVHRKTLYNSTLHNLKYLSSIVKAFQ